MYKLQKFESSTNMIFVIPNPNWLILINLD